jgi:hypothetical protein
MTRAGQAVLPGGDAFLAWHKPCTHPVNSGSVVGIPARRSTRAGMNFSELFKRISSLPRSGFGAPIMLMVVLAPRMMDVVPLAPLMPDRTRSA